MNVKCLRVWGELNYCTTNGVSTPPYTFGRCFSCRTTCGTTRFLRRPTIWKVIFDTECWQILAQREPPDSQCGLSVWIYSMHLIVCFVRAKNHASHISSSFGWTVAVARAKWEQNSLGGLWYMYEATTMEHCLCHELAENGFAPIQLGSTLASVEVGCECLHNRVTEHGHLSWHDGCCGPCLQNARRLSWRYLTRHFDEVPSLQHFLTFFTSIHTTASLQRRLFAATLFLPPCAEFCDERRR